jgi:taurine dioxygenase
MKVVPSGETLGARIEEVDLSDGLSDADFVSVLRALGEHGVLCFPDQDLETEDFATFGRLFGDLAVNIANDLHAPGLPEVMILSNMVEDGKPLGLADAGQGWHTDQSYSHEVALANILIADKVPRRGGKVLGNTQFLNMHAAYEGLPDEVKDRLEGKTAMHDFEKFWEVMRKRPGSRRQPMTAEQKAKKPPVSHPIFRTHPLTGRRVLYCNPGYAIRIDGMDAAESDEMLEFLFAHQMRDDYLYAHNWTEGDVLMWDNIGTVHNAVADYGPDEHRYMRRVQVMATRDYESILGA